LVAYALLAGGFLLVPPSGGEVERRAARGQYPLAWPDPYARHPSKREAGECCERRLKFAALLGFLAWHARSGIGDRKTQ